MIHDTLTYQEGAFVALNSMCLFSNKIDLEIEGVIYAAISSQMFSAPCSVTQELYGYSTSCLDLKRSLEAFSKKYEQIEGCKGDEPSEEGLKVARAILEVRYDV